METPWIALSPAEQRTIDDLSMDLNESFETKAVGAPEPLTQEAQVKIIEAEDAIRRNDWDLALRLLRQWGKYRSASEIAYLRGQAWMIAGFPEVATAFLEHARRLLHAPNNGSGVVSATLGSEQVFNLPSS